MLKTIPLLIAMLCTTGLSVASDTRPHNDKESIQDATEALDSAMRQFMWRHGVPGAAVAVAVDGEVVYENGFGWADVENAIPVTPTSRFRIGSITKPFTAVAILQLVEQGKLSLDDNPFDVIGMGEEIRDPNADPQLRNITIEQCLSHTSGLAPNGPLDPMFSEEHLTETLELESRPQSQDLVRYIATQRLCRQPGTYHDYSNVGYTLLHLVLEHVTDKPYESVIQEQIAEPLHLTDIALGGPLPSDKLDGEVMYYDRMGRTWTIPSSGEPTEKIAVAYPYHFPPPAFAGAGGLIASAGSLAKFVNDLHQRGQSTILNGDRIQQMWTPTLTSREDHLSGYPSGKGYGLGWGVGLIDDENCNAWHAGSFQGASQSFLVQFSDGCSIAVLFNTSGSAITDNPLNIQFENELLTAAKQLGTLHIKHVSMLNE